MIPRVFAFRFVAVFFVALLLVNAVTSKKILGAFGEDAVEEAAEDLAYKTMEDFIVSSGDPREYATCFVQFMRMLGMSKDVLSLSITINSHDSDELIDKLKEKAAIADFICQFGLPGVILFIAFALLLLCCCCVCCVYCLRCACCSKPSPIFIHAPPPTAGKTTKRSSRREEKVEMNNQKGSPISHVEV